MLFQDKIFFVLFLIIFLILFFYFKKDFWDKKISVKVWFFSDAKKFFWPKTRLEKIFYFLKKNFLFLLKIFSLIFLIFILAKPQIQNLFVERKYSWIDVVLAVDTSLSMLAEDIKPNRMTAARNTILKFIDWLRLWDRMSLVVFSWRPFTDIPLTWDLKILKEFAGHLSTDLINQNVIWLNWTWLWDALLYSVDKFWKKNNREKVLILMTDWESNRWIDPYEATKLAVDKNVKVYTIWVWRIEWAEIPIILQSWKTWFIKNPDWSKYLTSLDEHTLIQIAQKTWWKYFHTASKDTLDQVFKEIYSLEKKEIIFKDKKTYQDDFYIFAILAFLFFWTEFFLSLTYLKRKF